MDGTYDSDEELKLSTSLLYKQGQKEFAEWKAEQEKKKQLELTEQMAA